jgi:lipopolysaccharide export system permease protein
MWAAGIGPRQINLIVFRFLLAFAAVTSGISLYLSPEAFAAHEAVLARVRAEADLSMVLPGQFLELRNGEVVAYAEALSADGREMQNVFARFTIAGSQNILVAKRAHFSGRKKEFGRYIVLEDGYRYSGSPGSVDYTVYRFGKHGIRIDQRPTGSVSGKANAIPTWDLLKSPHPGYTMELQWRISQPISVLLLGMLAVPLARTLPRQGKHARLTMGIAIYFLYENAAGIMQNLAEHGQLSTLIGIWPVHLMMALVVGTLLYIQSTGRLPVLGKRNKSVQET